MWRGAPETVHRYVAPETVGTLFARASSDVNGVVERATRRGPSNIATNVTAALGAALIVAAIAADQSWLDRHFLPSFFLPREWYVAIESSVRIAIAATGAVLALARRRIASVLTDAPMTTLQVIAAVVLAIGAGEWAIHLIQVRPTEWLRPEEEPRRQDDAQLGWVLAPARVGRAVVAGRSIEYAIDAAGYRVQRLDEPVDRERPTLVFAGESVMFGEGLTGDESIPSQVGMLVGLQSANLAVHGYSTDQMYMRLARELPRFRRPMAVVGVFMTELFGRNLDDDRPHLGPGLQWLPAQHPSHVAALASLLVPYRRDETVALGVETTRDALRAIVQLAHDRNAMPLFVVPRFGKDDGVQQALRRRIFTDGIPAVDIQLDPAWRLPWDRHPNARAARAIAAVVAERLRRSTSGG